MTQGEKASSSSAWGNDWSGPYEADFEKVPGATNKEFAIPHQLPKAPVLSSEALFYCLRLWLHRLKEKLRNTASFMHAKNWLTTMLEQKISSSFESLSWNSARHIRKHMGKITADYNGEKSKDLFYSTQKNLGPHHIGNFTTPYFSQLLWSTTSCWWTGLQYSWVLSLKHILLQLRERLGIFIFTLCNTKLYKVWWALLVLQQKSINILSWHHNSVLVQ